MAREAIRRLRERLQAAVSAEQFSDAASLRDELKEAEASLADDDDTAVYTANDAFYAAFRVSDAEQMAKVWMSSENVSCAHPLAGLVVGFEEVIASWRTLFAMGKASSVEVEEISVNVRRNVAWIVCRQDVKTVRGNFTIGGTRIATNVFQKRKGEWWMVHYHASPVAVEGVEERDE